MNRRTFLSAVTGGLLGAPLATGAPQAGRISRVGWLSPDAAPAGGAMLGALRDGLRELGYADGQNIQFEPRWAERQIGRLPVLAEDLVRLPQSPDEFESTFATMVRKGVGALHVNLDPLFMGNRPRLIQLAMTYRLPATYDGRQFVDSGGLMAYGPSFLGEVRRAAILVDKILKGARPADLPVEQPTKLELVINLKTAKALGLTIPPSLLVRADQVIE